MKIARAVRSVIFWTHLSVAVVIGVVVFVLSVTGVLLAYERELVGRPGQSERSVASAVGGSGRREAEPTTPMRAFFSGAERVHRSLSLSNMRGNGGRSVGAGRTIVRMCNAAFLFLIVTGMYLWLPRRWSRLTVRRTALFHRGAKGRHRDWNWHHVFGFWMAVPLLLIVGAGVLMSYQGPRIRVEKMLGIPVEPVLRPQGANGEGGERRPEVGGATQGRGRAERGDRQGAPIDPATRKFRGVVRGLHTGQIGGFLGETVAALASLAAALLVWTGLALTWRRFWRKFRPGSATLAES